MFSREETIMVVPDLYDPQENLQLIQSNKGFTDFFKRGEGWPAPSYLLRPTNRGDAEKVPNPHGERIRQLVANILTFIVPDAIVGEIERYGYDPTDFDLIRRIIQSAQLFATKKLKGSGEQRLHGKLAAGLGGHVDAEDFEHELLLDNPPDFIDRLIHIAAVRELREEMTCRNMEVVPKHVVPFGVINSSASEVESVHLGFINVLAMPESLNVAIRETDNLAPVMIPLSELKHIDRLSELYELDNWTQIIFRMPASIIAHYIAMSIAHDILSIVKC